MADLSLMKPVLVQVLLTFVMLGFMASARLTAIRKKEVELPPDGTRPVFKDYAAQCSNAFHNQLEMPMLFFAAAAFAILTNSQDWEMTAFAWGYVICRIIQASIHVSYNHIPHRFLAFLGSNIFLVAMWVNIALHVLLGW